MANIVREKPLVLVVDDEINAATMLRHIFEREGYAVEIAPDGIKALNLVQSLTPDLILLDIQMPQMDGFEVLRRLRENSATAAIPTIVVSARARKPSDIVMGLSIGADDYISKPFAPQELLARARSKMRARQLEESLQQRTQELEVLLRISEALNRHLEFDELFSLVLFFLLDLMPADIAFVAQLDEAGHIDTYRIQTKDDVSGHHDQRFLEEIEANNKLFVNTHQWSEQENDTPLLGYRNGIAIPLTHGESRLGLLLIVSNEQSFTQNHLMLFEGIARQTGLALHNAELYEIQANYAHHLEEMVAQRTEELQKTQQMLFRSEKLASIGHLAASIAHEINNPLQPIQLNLEYLVEDAQSGRPIDAEVIAMTQDSVNRISRIVRQLLEFTKSNSESALAEVSIVEVAESVLKLNERNLERSNIAIETDFQPVHAIEGNRDQLEQVFMNIILNAKGAMPSGGTLTIRAWNEEHGVKIQFVDTGEGISDEMIHKVFDPFVSTKPNGTGLGLFVTYGIIEKHQGQIEVQSKVNFGTTFTITLPREHSRKALADDLPR
jgi:signal transduction histidine kinase